MGDISTWNPVDNSNTTAPPDGWPEGMAPSAVNNSARAMMGAVRRWYDTVTAQISGMLPLVGGTLSGALHAPYLHSTGTVQADGAMNAATANISGTVTAAQLTSAGNINATAGTMTAGTVNTGNATATGTVTAQYVNASNAGIVGTVTAASMTATGTITAANFVGNVSVPSNGPVTTGGTVTGGTVTSTGNITAPSGTVSGANVTASSNITAAGSMTAGSLHATGDLQVDASATINNTLYVGGPVTFNNTLSVNGACYNASGSWIAFSARELKENIVPYDGRGLEAVLALRPVSFNYRPDLFGPEEAEKTRYGLVADEVAQVLPEMVGEAPFGGQNLSTLNTGHLPIVLLNACRELAAQNAALAARITALEGEQTHV